MGKTIDIGGRIHNPEVGNTVTGANEILDDTKNKKQDVINSEVDAALEALDANKQDNLTFDQTPTEDSTNPVTSGGVYAADALLQQAIEAILALIPSAATALNQLADKAFVNSTEATNTATFRGTYNVVTDLGLAYNASHQDIATALLSHIATADNNDYAFVQIPVSGTSEDIRVTERYKFNGTVWGYEYDLNNSGFTALQWAAINSGITALLVEKLSALPTAAELALALAGKQATLTFDNAPVSGSDNPVKSGGLYELFTAINAKFPANASADNKLVAEDRLAAYVTAIIGALDASFDLTSADGHVTFRMTQTNGVIASVQILTSDIASASQVSTNTTDIANLQQLYNDLQQSKPVPVTSLPTTGQQQGVIYRLAGTTSYADYMWNGSGWVMMAEYNNAIDNKPTTESDNLVTSGGVAEGINIIGANISAIDASYNLVNNITIGRGIDENGIISTNSARAIFIVRIAEGSTTTSISTDVPIVSWNYYSGVPNIKTGSNFMPDRVVTPVTTRTVRSGAKYLIIMLNISNGNPTYIYVKQEGNFVNRIDVESTIINVSQLYPTGGTSGTNVYTQTEARQKVPVELRKKGTILIYNYASFVRIEQYYDEYTNESDWLYGDSWRNFDTSDFVDLCRLRNVESFSTRVDALGFTPTPLRKACTLVSYKLTNGDAFLEMFIGSTWSLQDQYWIRFVDSATVASLSTLLSELENKTGYDDNILMVSASYAIEANQNNFVVPQNNVSNVPSKRKKGYIKVTGFDAFVIFYNEVFQRLTSYYTQDGVDTEITIPSEACLFRVYKKNQEVVAESTPFTLKVYYSNEWDRYQEYADSLVLSNTRMILRNLNRTKISSATNTPDTTYKTLTLGCLTDIHNDVWCASKFVELNKALKEHVDDVWGLGDYVNSSLDDLYSLDSISGFGDIIKIIGNHDAYDKWPNPNIVAESVDYTDFLASDISGWGVQYTANKCYFYKDYPNANIRVIALDYMHWDEVNDTNGQKAWLVATLESARIEGYHVIIAVHSPIISEYSGSILSYDRFAFHFLDEDGTINVGWDGNSVLEIVDNFQQQGGTFICYMTGHRHFDFIGAYENYPNQIVLNQCCTSGITAGNDTEWSTDCEWALRFNYYSFDYKSKFIRVYQYGNSFNRNMQHKISALLTYDVNKQNKLLY